LSLNDGSTNVASAAAYNAAGQLTSLTYGPSWTETRTYNTLGQMTRMTIPSTIDFEYTFHATQNNGRITKYKDHISGEEVNYTYDSLSRLATAATTSTAWGLSFGYDGFGNKLSQTVTKGSAPAMSITVDASTNRITSHTYDSNGNTTNDGTRAMTYDISNRIANVSGGPSNEWYGYGGDNKRVWKKRQTGGSTYEENVYFYGAGGQRFGTYTLTDTSGTLALAVKETNVYFAGKVIKQGSTWVAMDRLGSVRYRSGSPGASSDYWPYGEEKPSTTTQDRDKFATYMRDHTNLDYADQRYFTSAMGRFLTPDPYHASAAGNHPETWNRYAYVASDPINNIDPSGEFFIPVFGDIFGWIGRIFGIISGLPPLPSGADGNGSAIVKIDPEWKKNPEKKVKEVDAAIAAALAANYAKEEEGEVADFRFPHHLQVMCDRYSGSAGGVRRERTYQLRDQKSEPMTVGGIVIKEQNYLVSGEITSGNASWIGPMFTDNLSKGFSKPVTQYQTFTAQIVRGLFVTPPTPVMIREQNGLDYGVLGIRMEADVIFINGNDGKVPDGRGNRVANTAPCKF